MQPGAATKGSATPPVAGRPPRRSQEPSTLDGDDTTIPLHGASPILAGANDALSNLIPVSLGRPTPHPDGQPVQTLLSATPLCMRTDRFDAVDTEGIAKCLGWDTATPAALKRTPAAAARPTPLAAEPGGTRQAIRELFKRDTEPRQQTEVSPAGFMKAMGQLPLEESLQYLVQSDLLPVRSPAHVMACAPLLQVPHINHQQSSTPLLLYLEAIECLLCMHHPGRSSDQSPSVLGDQVPWSQHHSHVLYKQLCLVGVMQTGRQEALPSLQEQARNIRPMEAPPGEGPSALSHLLSSTPGDGACRYTPSQQEYMYHLSLALKHLSDAEARRLMALLHQPTMQACIDTLSNICEPAPVTGMLDLPPVSFAMPAAPASKQCPLPSVGEVPPLRLDALATAALGSRHTSDTFSTHQSNVSSQPYSSMHISPRIMRSTTLTPRAHADASDVRPGPMPKGAMTDRPAARQRTKKRPHPDMEYGSALLDRMQEEQRAARKRSTAAAFADGSLTARIVSPRRRKSGPPSSRDKVWDLLLLEEKEQILRDTMSAAEGTKALLTRRAAQLHCAIVDMPDDDDWEIGFRLTECKATSEPLAKPKNCSICLRCALLFAGRACQRLFLAGQHLCVSHQSWHLC